MKNNGLSITAFAVVIFAIVATLAMIAFSEGIRKVDWMDLESTAWACFGLSILGCILGWCAFVVAGFFFQLLRSDGPSEPATEYNVEIQETEQAPAGDSKTRADGAASGTPEE
jgi:hypothetical protein